MFGSVIDDKAPMDSIPQWFPGSQLNFAENLMRFRDERVAIIYESEYEADRKIITYRELFDQVKLVAISMKQMNVVKGDVIAALAGNIPEVVTVMLASASLGAIFTSLSADFGITAIKERLIQTKPKILFASDAVFYNGKVHEQISKVSLLRDEIPSIEKFIFFSSNLPKIPAFNYDHIYFEQLLRQDPSQTFEFCQLPFNHPLYILYSSGTTGKPKCLVHSSGGTLIQHLKEHTIHGDIDRNDIFFQYTTIGWMMWHWMVSSLAIGCTILLYEGSPFKPTPTRLWSLVEKYKITRFGTSAKYIQHLQDCDLKFSNQFDLSSLKTIYSTGSPLSPSNFNFVYGNIKADLQLSSITGGTDIISLFGAGNPILPVFAGEIQCPALGMSIKSFSEDGNPIWDAPGDLVCTRPFPSMPVYFWNDQNNSLYKAAYFERYEHIWHHGDFVQFNSKTGGIVMLGRSDGTLNPAGVRFGSAELYNILFKFPEILDSIVVGVKRSGETDEKVYMFLMTENNELQEHLVNRIKTEIRTMLSPRHVPAVILSTPTIPYTINGKKLEVPVKRILSGQTNLEVTSIANPESLDYFRLIAKSM